MRNGIAGGSGMGWGTLGSDVEAMFMQCGSQWVTNNALKSGQVTKKPLKYLLSLI